MSENFRLASMRNHLERSSVAQCLDDRLPGRLRVPTNGLDTAGHARASGDDQASHLMVRSARSARLETMGRPRPSRRPLRGLLRMRADEDWLFVPKPTRHLLQKWGLGMAVLKGIERP